MGGIGEYILGISQKKPRKRRKIPKSVKIKVWEKYFGLNTAVGKCYVCGRPIHITDFEVGHNKAVSRGGSDRISNLRPICATCNRSMGTMSIEAYKRKYFGGTKKQKMTRKRKKKLFDGLLF